MIKIFLLLSLFFAGRYRWVVINNFFFRFYFYFLGWVVKNTQRNVESGWVFIIIFIINPWLNQKSLLRKLKTFFKIRKIFIITTKYIKFLISQLSFLAWCTKVSVTHNIKNVNLVYLFYDITQKTNFKCHDHSCVIKAFFNWE